VQPATFGIQQIVVEASSVLSVPARIGMPCVAIAPGAPLNRVAVAAKATTAPETAALMRERTGPPPPLMVENPAVTPFGCQSEASSPFPHAEPAPKRSPAGSCGSLLGRIAEWVVDARSVQRRDLLGGLIRDYKVGGLMNRSIGTLQA
jgi:hypothetical protein